MRSAISGDSAAYHRLLKAVTPVLRAAARRGLARAGQPVDQSEDIVQEVLLAVHLKRHTWDAARDRKSTRLNSSHRCISYAVFCLKKKKKKCTTRSEPEVFTAATWVASRRT